MPSVIDTSKVIGRRQLHFTCLQDILADVDQLARAKDIRCLGNWSAGQVLKHLTIVMNGSMDGSLTCTILFKGGLSRAGSSLRLFQRHQRRHDRRGPARRQRAH